MKKTLLLPALFVSFIGLLSCSDDPSDASADADYFPLATGNEWHYVRATPQLPEQSSAVFKITGTTDFNGISYHRMTRSFNYGTGERTDTVYYRIDANGFVYEYKPGLQELNRFRLQAMNGDTWNIETSLPETYVVKTTAQENYDLTASIKIDHAKSFFYDIPRAADDEYYIVLGKGLGIVKQGSAWGFDLRLETAVIDGQRYDF